MLTYFIIEFNTLGFTKL